MAINRHIVAKQIFELSLVSGMDAYLLQERFSRIYWEKVVPELSELFDQLSDPEMLIRIDYLEIDLGLMDIQELESELSNRLIRVLENKLRGLLAAAHMQVQQMTYSYSHFEAWLHFLEKGYLPWTTSNLLEEELHEAALSTIASEEKAVVQFRKLVLNHAQVAKRLAIQHSPAFLRQLAEAVSGQPQADLLALGSELEKLVSHQELMKQLSSVIDHPASMTQIQTVFWTKVIHLLAEGQKQILSADFVQHILRGATEHTISKTFMASLVHYVETKSKDFPILKKMRLGKSLASSGIKAIDLAKDEVTKGEEVPVAKDFVADPELSSQESQQLITDQELIQASSKPSTEPESSSASVEVEVDEEPFESKAKGEKNEIESKEADENETDLKKITVAEGVEASIVQEAKANPDLKSEHENQSVTEEDLSKATDDGSMEPESPLDSIDVEKEALEAEVQGEIITQQVEPEGQNEQSNVSQVEREDDIVQPPSESSFDRKSEEVGLNEDELVDEETVLKAEAIASLEKRKDQKTKDESDIGELAIPNSEIIQDITKQEPDTFETRKEASPDIDDRTDLEKIEVNAIEDKGLELEESTILEEEIDKKIDSESSDSSKQEDGAPETTDEIGTSEEDPAPVQLEQKTSEIEVADGEIIDASSASKDDLPQFEEAGMKTNQEVEDFPELVKDRPTTQKEDHVQEEVASDEMESVNEADKDIRFVKEAEGQGEKGEDESEIPLRKKVAENERPEEKEDSKDQDAIEKDGIRETHVESGKNADESEFSETRRDLDESEKSPVAKNEQLEREIFFEETTRTPSEEEKLEAEQTGVSERPEIETSTSEGAPAVAQTEQDRLDEEETEGGGREEPSRSSKQADTTEKLEIPSEKRKNEQSSTTRKKRAVDPVHPAFTDQPEGTVYYVHNAGVILVHAFVKTYFEAMELVKEKEFVDEMSQHKGIHLIEYLATGRLKQAEYELVLPKFLCNFSLETPLMREVDIKETELAEAENLLQAAIKYWGAIGKSSPDALREGFLQREGKLERRANGWYLVVERVTMDILLDRLPWNLSMVKLPWMKDLLRIEW